MLPNRSESMVDAERHVSRGDLRAAAGIYRQIIEDDPFDFTAVNALCDLFVKAGKVSEAITELSRIAEGYLVKGCEVNAAYVLKKVLELDPYSTTVHIRLAAIYAHQGMSEKAYESFIAAESALLRSGNIAAAREIKKKALAIKSDGQPVAVANTSALRPEPGLPAGEVARVPGSTPNQSPNASPQPPLVPEQRPAPTTELRPAPAPESRPAPIAESRPATTTQARPAPATDLRPAAAADHLAGNDDGFVIQQLSKAEMLVGYGDVGKAVELLKDMVRQRPDNISVRIKLKDIYLRSAMMEKAGEVCFEIARLYAAQGDAERARDYAVRARRLAQSIQNPGSAPPQTRLEETDNVQSRVTSAIAPSPERKAPTQAAVESSEGPIQPQARQPKVEAPVEPTPQHNTIIRPVEPTPQPDTIIRPVESTPRPETIVRPVDRTPDTKAISVPAGDAPLADEPEVAEAVDAVWPMAIESPAYATTELKAPAVRQRPRWVYGAVAAAVLVAVASGGFFKGVPIYEERLDREYEALVRANPLPPPTMDLDAIGPDEQQGEQMDVRANDSPEAEPAQPNDNARNVEQPTKERVEQSAPKPQPTTSQPVPAVAEQPKAIKPPSVTPPIEPSISQTSPQTEAPRGVPTGMPGRAAGMQEPPPPPAAPERKPGALIRGDSIRQEQPIYPFIARSARLTGTVSVQVTVNDRGDVVGATAVSGPEVLRASAVAAARHWKFKPSMRDGKPVGQVTTITFNFKL